MCGIAGLIDESLSSPEREVLVRGMVKRLAHRGPDAQQVRSSGPATLGVARLSIVDRAQGAQPMEGRLGPHRGLLSYNGEVYNHAALRPSLEELGYPFRTACDAEVVLAGHLCRGQDAVHLLDGMFAYGLWREDLGELWLVRDRLGIKPLYYVELGDALVFASEPKALLLHPRLERRPDPGALLDYFLYGAAFAAGHPSQGLSFFHGVQALRPGHLLIFSPGHGVRLRRYWSPLDDLGEPGHSQAEASEAVIAALDRSVSAQLMGEAPVGTALSGGLDSSLLTALATRASGHMVSACITFQSNGSDPDAAHARLVSNWLNQETPGSHQLAYSYLPASAHLSGLDAMIGAFDEPHWEMRQLGMFENYRTLGKLGRTVVLTGEGADELFFGYYQKFPGFRTPLSGPDDLAKLWRQRIPWVQALLRPAFCSGLLTQEQAEEHIARAIDDHLAPVWEASGDRLRAMQCFYLQTFLHWLVMVNDRCAMAHSIEGRFPFLSRELVRLALQFPPSWSLDFTEQIKDKTLLRRAARGRLPDSIWRDRAKSPLPVPGGAEYHRQIAERLHGEAEMAAGTAWCYLDRGAVLDLCRSFQGRLSEVPVDLHTPGEWLTQYVPPEQPLHVRSAHLFAVLSCLRWFDLFVDEKAIPHA